MFFHLPTGELHDFSSIGSWVMLLLLDFGTVSYVW
jgi:hypothetical protein